MEKFSIEKAGINAIVKSTLQDLGIKLDVPITHYITPHCFPLYGNPDFAYILPDNKQFITHSKNHLLIRSLENGEILQSIYTPILKQITPGRDNYTDNYYAIHASGKYVLATERIWQSELSILKIFEIPSGEKIWQSEPGKFSVKGIVTPKFDQYLVFALHTSSDYKSEIAIFDFKNRRFIEKFIIPVYSAIRVLPNFDTIIFSRKHEIIWYRNGVQNNLTRFDEFKDIESFHLKSYISADGAKLFTSQHNSQTLEIRDIPKGNHIKSFPVEVKAFYGSTDPNLVYLIEAGCLHLFDLQSQEIIKKIPFNSNFTFSKIEESSNNKLLFCYDTWERWNYQNLVINTETSSVKELKHNLFLDNPDYRIYCLDNMLLLFNYIKQENNQSLTCLNCKTAEIEWIRSEKKKVISPMLINRTYFSVYTYGKLRDHKNADETIDLVDLTNQNIRIIENKYPFHFISRLSEDVFMRFGVDKTGYSKNQFFMKFFHKEAEYEDSIICEPCEYKFSPDYNTFIVVEIFRGYVESKQIIKEEKLIRVYDISDRKTIKLLNNIEVECGYEIKFLCKGETTVIYSYSSEKEKNFIQLIDNKSGTLELDFSLPGSHITAVGLNLEAKILAIHQLAHFITIIDLNTGKIKHTIYDENMIELKKIKIIDSENIVYQAHGLLCNYNISKSQTEVLFHDCVQIYYLDENKIYYQNQSGGINYYNISKRKLIASIFLSGNKFLISTPADQVSETGWFYTNDTDLVTVAEKDSNGNILKILEKGNPEREVYITAHNRKDIVVALLNEDNEGYMKLVQSILTNQLKLDFQRKNNILALNHKNENEIST